MKLIKKIFSKKEKTIVEPTLKEQLNFKDIRTRRIFNQDSFEIEKLIHFILSSQSDRTGQKLIKLTIAIFKKLGYTAKNNDGYKDKKKDILIYKNHETQPYAVIQCKSYSPQNTQSRLLKGDLACFAGYTEEFQHNRIFITSSYFDKGAINDFSEKLILIDRIGLIHLLMRTFPNETLNVLNSFSLHELKYDCPKCGFGKIQKLHYSNNIAFKCTNCSYRFKNKKGKGEPNFSKGDYDKY